MANIDELTTKVLHGLERCGLDPESLEDCGECPYKSIESCIAHMSSDARKVIIHLDKLVEQMGRGGVVIDRSCKAVEALRYCKGHSECYGTDPDCPYHVTSGDCMLNFQRDLLAMIDGGDEP